MAVVSAIVSEEMKKAINERAIAEECSFSVIIRRAIRRELNGTY